jgi:phospholipid-binding lipoprotein MlaA
VGLAFLSAIVLASAAPAGAAAQAPEACDPRVIVLPGEAPLGMRCAAAAPGETANPASPAGAELQDDGNTIVVTGSGPPPGDPLAQVNAQTFEAMQSVDQALVEPVAYAYRDELPKPVRKGLSHFFRNLREPVVFLNFMLQLKPGKAFETLGRFAINSTLGLGGVLDVAKKKPFNLPYRHNGFANTLGYYGVGPGPFLYLPLVGATTVRDLLGTVADAAVLPTAVGKPFNTIAYSAPAYVVTSLDSRIEFDDEIQRIRNADEPYTTMRETYLAKRQREIDALHGRERTPQPDEDPPPGDGDVPVIVPSPVALDLDLAVPAG